MRYYNIIAKILPEQGDANLNKPDNYGPTPYYTTQSGKRENGEKYYPSKKKVNPNKPHNYDQTPLYSSKLHGLMKTTLTVHATVR